MHACAIEAYKSCGNATHSGGRVGFYAQYSPESKACKCCDPLKLFKDEKKALFKEGALVAQTEAQNKADPTHVLTYSLLKSKRVIEGAVGFKLYDKRAPPAEVYKQDYTATFKLKPDAKGDYTVEQGLVFSSNLLIKARGDQANQKTVGIETSKVFYDATSGYGVSVTNYQPCDENTDMCFQNWATDLRCWNFNPADRTQDNFEPWMEMHVSPKAVASTFTRMTMNVNVEVSLSLAMTVTGYNHGGEVVTLWNLKTGKPLDWLGGIAAPGAREEWFMAHTGKKSEPGETYQVLSKLRSSYNTPTMKGEACFKVSKNLCEAEYGKYANECSWHKDNGGYCGPGIFWEKTEGQVSAGSEYTDGTRDIQNRVWWHWNQVSRLRTGGLQVDFYEKKAAVYRRNGHFAVIDFLNAEDKKSTSPMKITNYYTPGKSTTTAPTTQKDLSIETAYGTLAPGISGMEVNFKTHEAVTAASVPVVGGRGFKLYVTLWNMTNGRTIRQLQRTVHDTDQVKSNIPMTVNWEEKWAVVAHRNRAFVYDLHSTSAKPAVTLQDKENPNALLIRSMLLEQTKEPEKKIEREKAIEEVKKDGVVTAALKKAFNPVKEFLTETGEGIKNHVEDFVGDIGGKDVDLSVPGSVKTKAKSSLSWSK